MTCRVRLGLGALGLLIAVLPLAARSGESRLDATAMLDYFAPLRVWLDEQNRGQECGW